MKLVKDKKRNKTQKHAKLSLADLGRMYLVLVYSHTQVPFFYCSYFTHVFPWLILVLVIVLMYSYFSSVHMSTIYRRESENKFIKNFRFCRLIYWHSYSSTTVCTRVHWGNLILVLTDNHGICTIREYNYKYSAHH